jgi:hypothetical protein
MFLSCVSRVAHAVKYLHAYRNDFTAAFKQFYGAHDCDSLVVRSQDSLTRVGEELLNTSPSGWTFEFLESLASQKNDHQARSPPYLRSNSRVMPVRECFRILASQQSRCRSAVISATAEYQESMHSCRREIASRFGTDAQ